VKGSSGRAVDLEPDLRPAAAASAGAQLAVVALVADAVGELGLLADLANGVVLRAHLPRRHLLALVDLPLHLVQLLPVLPETPPWTTGFPHISIENLLFKLLTCVMLRLSKQLCYNRVRKSLW